MKKNTTFILTNRIGFCQHKNGCTQCKVLYVFSLMYICTEISAAWIFRRCFRVMLLCKHSVLSAKCVSLPTVFWVFSFAKANTRLAHALPIKLDFGQQPTLRNITTITKRMKIHLQKCISEKHTKPDKKRAALF